ncbi:MAG TPA: urea amidolyase associated protein UAAP1 [Acidimicrobiales bacterium]|nr:urea amidolyase associated protein UAAP1 [Acidimicrobiales bacterium]
MASPTSGPTATTHGARDHARAQGNTVVDHMPTVPARSYPAPPEGVDPDRLVWAEMLAPGGYSQRILAAGTTIRLTDVEGDACAHLLLFRAGQTWERLCVADTVKVQWQAYTTTGQLLLSDQGRVLATVVADTSGRHDALCGTSTLVRNEERYGTGRPEGPSPAGRELFVLGAAKCGLTPRDLPPSVSFFKGVTIHPATGQLEWVGGSGGPATVALRAEMPLVVLLANTAHPVDPRPEWHCTGLGVLAWSGEPSTPADDHWSSTPEHTRAFLNTAEDLAGRRC